jgi:YbbR domain-containing protein
VTVRGASARVEAVWWVVARVAIDARALNVDREVALIAVDSNGNQVPNVEIDPERTRVRIAVARELANRTLPLVPNITGLPAAGFRVTSVTVEPLVVTVSGEDATVSQLETAETEPIDVTGRDRDLEATVRVALPSGVSVAGSDTARVVITIGEDTGTRTFQVGVQLDGESPEISYDLSQPTVNVTLGGAVAALDAVDAAQLTARADVGALPDSLGPHVVPLVVAAPEGLNVVSIDPDAVVVNTQSAVAPSISNPPP